MLVFKAVVRPGWIRDAQSLLERGLDASVVPLQEEQEVRHGLDGHPLARGKGGGGPLELKVVGMREDYSANLFFVIVPSIRSSCRLDRRDHIPNAIMIDMATTETLEKVDQEALTAFRLRKFFKCVLHAGPHCSKHILALRGERERDHNVRYRTSRSGSYERSCRALQVIAQEPCHAHLRGFFARS